MNEISTNIDFADGSYRSCKTDNSNLIVYFDSWDDKTIKITFFNAIRFLYRGGSFIAGIYEKTEDLSFLLEALSSEYVEIPEDHPFKMFVVIDIDDQPVFEVVAETVHWGQALQNCKIQEGAGLTPIISAKMHESRRASDDEKKIIDRT